MRTFFVMKNIKSRYYYVSAYLSASLHLIAKSNEEDKKTHDSVLQKVSEVKVQFDEGQTHKHQQNPASQLHVGAVHVHPRGREAWM